MGIGCNQGFRRREAFSGFANGGGVVRFISAIRLVRRSLRDTGQRLVGGNRAGAGRSAPAIRTEPAWLVAACRGTRFVSLAAAVLFGSMVVANAA
jgi:hypothetical protein